MEKYTVKSIHNSTSSFGEPHTWGPFSTLQQAEECVTVLAARSDVQCAYIEEEA